MSEIDFNEIEKAIQKMASGDQQKKRATQLKVKVKQRDEATKRIDTERDQGKIATQRIIKGSTTLRSKKSSQESSPKSHPPKIPAIKSEAKSTSDSVSTKIDKEEEPFKFSSESPELNKNQTIGELSDRYILSDFDQEESKTNDVPESTKEGLSFEENPKDSGFEEEKEDQTPKESPAEPKIYGAVHATYGQRIPNRYIPKSGPKISSKNPPEPTKLAKKPKDNLHKKFKIWRTVSLILMLASILVWATILYLWFISG